MVPGTGRLRIVFLGTPDIALPVLAALLAAPLLEVALVVTQPDRPAGRGRRLAPPPVKVLAEQYAVPVFQPERLRGDEALERLRAASADLFVITAYGQILRQAILDIPRFGCLNVHPSLLPRHRGPAPVAAAILAGDEETGVTIMLTDRGMDTGPILTQATVPLGRDETSATLTPRLLTRGAELLLRTIPAWVDGIIAPLAQDETIATLSHTFTREDGLLDWTRSAIDLERQVRALNPWPRAYTFVGGKRLLVLRAQAIEDAIAVSGREPIAESGTIIAAEPGSGLLVATRSGMLRLLEVQPEGRQPIAGDTYLRGQRDLVGRTLGVAGQGSQ